MTNGPFPSESPSPQPSDGQGSTSGNIPEPVTQLAAQRGFGALIDMRSDGTRAEKALGGCAIAVGSLLLMVLVAYLAPEDDPFSFSLLSSVLRFFALFFLFVAVWAAAAGLRGLIVAPRSHYLYEGGIIYAAGKRLQPAAWEEISHLTTIYGNRATGTKGKILGYKVWLGDTTSFDVPLILTDGRDSFMDRIIHEVRSRNRPIR